MAEVSKIILLLLSRLVPMCFFLDLLVLTCNISIETCAYVLLSWYALRGEVLRPPPCTPPPALFLNRFPLLPTIPFFLHKHHRLFGLISSLLISIETCAYVLISWSSRSYLQYIHWDLCLCASLLVRIAGGGAAPSPLHPPLAFFFKPVPLATYNSFLFA